MQKKQAKFYLRYRILRKRQILHQDIEAFVFFIQKLSDPSVGGKKIMGEIRHMLCHERPRWKLLFFHHKHSSPERRAVTKEA